LLVIEIMNNCATKYLVLVSAPYQHQYPNALLAQLDRASVF